MVEFGLKLEDNKVAEWSDEYISYEQLKAILSKAAAAAKRYADLKAKRPEVADSIKDAYLKGMPTPSPSEIDLRNYSQEKLVDSLSSPLRLNRTGSNVSKDGKDSSPVRVQGSTLTTDAPAPKKNGQLAKAASSSECDKLMLTSSDRPDYGSARGETTERPDSGSGSSIPRRDSSGNLLARVLVTAASGITEYFLTRTYAPSVRDALKEIDKQREAFDELLTKDLETVNGFYGKKLREVEDRLQFLKESVASYRRKSVEPMHPIAMSSPPSSPTAASNKAVVSPSSPPPAVAEEEEEASAASFAVGKRLRSNSTPADPRTYESDDFLERPLIEPKHRTTPLQFVRKSMVQFKAHRRMTTNAPIHTGIDDGREDVVENAPNSGGAPDVAESKKDKEARKKKVREAESIQRALVDQYRTAKLLHNYAIMNYTGFVKIVKKYNKTLPEYKGRYKDVTKPENVCNEGRDVEALASRMEQLYANWFCDRNVSEARAQMLPKRGDGLEMDWSQLRLGYRMGMCSILGLWVGWDCIWGMLAMHESTIGARTAFPVFRATGGLLVLQWFWGCSVWVWRRYRVNYIYLFDFNPHIVATPLAIFNEAVDNSLVFLVTMLLYYKAGANDIPGDFPAGVFPFFIVLYTIYQLVFPLNRRRPMWRAIWLLVTAPMTSPSFFHGYVGDIFTSLVKVFQDLAWTFFFVVNGDWLISEDLDVPDRHGWHKTLWYHNLLIPLLTLLPLWFRFNQCLRRYLDTGDRFPHLANAFKYAMSQTVTLFGAFHPLYKLVKPRGNSVDLFQILWIIIFVSSSLYSFFWDVYMDWGLGRPKYGFLGRSLMYPQRAGYYVIIAVDLVLRFAWVLTLVPPNSGATFALPAYLAALSMVMELFRRTIWGFLRLENEHRSNASGYRRIDFVPLHFSTGHAREEQEKKHRGFSVLAEVAVVSLLVVGACIYSVVAAQHATQSMAGTAG